MGAARTMGSEQQAYTLSDRATYVSRKAKGLDLDILVEGDPILLNPYGVIPVNPEAHPGINAEGGQTFADWLIALPAQQLIADYQVSGTQLFIPDSEAWRAEHPSE